MEQLNEPPCCTRWKRSFIYMHDSLYCMLCVLTHSRIEVSLMTSMVKLLPLAWLHVFLGFILSLTISATSYGYQTQQMAVERVCSVKRFTLWLLSLFIHNISLIHPSRHCAKTVHLYSICRIYCKGRLFAPPYCKKWCLQMWPGNATLVSSSLQGPWSRIERCPAVWLCENV